MKNEQKLREQAAKLLEMAEEAAKERAGALTVKSQRGGLRQHPLLRLEFSCRTRATRILEKLPKRRRRQGLLPYRGIAE